MSETHAGPSPLHRLGSSVVARRWGTVFTELVLIIVGILTALAIDGWAEERQDRKTEIAYLQLLHEDFVLIEDALQRYIDFETGNMKTAAAAYAAIAEENLPGDAHELRWLIAGLGTRRTLSIVSAAYTDLTSTGNLQLIGQQGLREKIVRYFSDTERIERVIEKNNTAFIDGTYFRFLIDSGITPLVNTSSEPILVEADALVMKLLGPDAALPRDKFLERPPQADSWHDLRRQILFRMRVASIGAMFGENRIQATQELRAEIEQELARRDALQETRYNRRTLM